MWVWANGDQSRTPPHTTNEQLQSLVSWYRQSLSSISLSPSSSSYFIYPSFPHNSELQANAKCHDLSEFKREQKGGIILKPQSFKDKSIQESSTSTTWPQLQSKKSEQTTVDRILWENFSTNYKGLAAKLCVTRDYNGACAAGSEEAEEGKILLTQKLICNLSCWPSVGISTAYPIIGKANVPIIGEANAPI